MPRPDRATKLAILAAGGLALALGMVARRDAPAPPFADPPSTRGRLVVSLYGPAPGGAPEPLSLHTSRFANGALEPGLWDGMEDNDLRGFLDGTFKWGWNQPGQVHVRLGRRAKGPRYGESELFRVLQRWSPLPLPAASEVLDAQLELEIEEGHGPAWPVRVLAYAVKKDWAPGGGGTLGDNASPPRRGEVWWNDVAFEERAWGLPGVSYASPDDPEADVEAEPLAEASALPGASRLVLAGERLTSYVAERVRAGRPLLLLLKLGDRAEDRPGSVLGLYSGNADDSANPARRPALVVRWRSAAERARLELPLHLEYGRSLRLPVLSAGDGDRVAMSFEPEPDSGLPALAVGEGPDPRWLAAGALAELEPGTRRLALRLYAVERPHPLGRPFRSRVTDTWVRSAPPESQEVRFTFVSPSGRRAVRPATYRGGATWEVSFEPDEPGPWHYEYTHRLADPFHSAPGRLDVVATDLAAVTQALEQLADETRARRGEPPPNASLRLVALERAGLALLSPESWRDAPGRALRRHLVDARAALGEAPPEAIPLRPTPPPEWATPSPQRDLGVWQPEQTPHRVSDLPAEAEARDPQPLARP